MKRKRKRKIKMKLKRKRKRKMKRKKKDWSKKKNKNKKKRRAKPTFSNISNLTRPWLRIHPTHTQPSHLRRLTQECHCLPDTDDTECHCLHEIFMFGFAKVIFSPKRLVCFRK